MAHDRKATEGASPGARGAKSPIPPGKKDDLEDVSWALSTAEAMWGRGDHADALKWLRRAAETAADAEEDDRALELAKAAADVATLITAAKSPAPAPIPSAAPAPPFASVSRPPPPAAAVAASAAPPLPASGPASGPASAPASGPVSGGAGPRVAAPLAPRVAGAQPALPRPGQKTPTPARVAQPLLSRRSGRRSSPSVTDDGGGEKPVVNGRGARGSTTNEARRRARASKPTPDETTPVEVPTRAGNAALHAPGDPDQWPTATLAGEDLDDEDQYTRIGTPAYQASAQKASARPPHGLEMHTSQAIRVVVWRTPDGTVRVAPVGTPVTAIAVEAVLVALDPTADLAAWLTNK